MKKGEIWGYFNPATGVKRGLKVTHYYPPMGECTRHLAYGHDVKDPYVYHQFVLSERGIPLLKDGTESPHWTLIEEAP